MPRRIVEVRRPRADDPGAGRGRLAWQLCVDEYHLRAKAAGAVGAGRTHHATAHHDELHRARSPVLARACSTVLARARSTVLARACSLASRWMSRPLSGSAGENTHKTCV